MTDKETMQQALERLERYQTKRGDYETFEQVIEALRAALERKETE